MDPFGVLPKLFDFNGAYSAGGAQALTDPIEIVCVYPTGFIWIQIGIGSGAL